MKKLRIVLMVMIFVFSFTIMPIEPILLYEQEITAGAATLSDNNGFVSVGTSISTSSPTKVGCLEQGQCLKNGNYVAGVQSDGNLVIYKYLSSSKTWSATWQSRTVTNSGDTGLNTFHARVGLDGNFVIYGNGTGYPETWLFQSCTLSDIYNVANGCSFSLRLDTTGELKLEMTVPGVPVTVQKWYSSASTTGRWRRLYDQKNVVKDDGIYNLHTNGCGVLAFCNAVSFLEKQYIDAAYVASIATSLGVYEGNLNAASQGILLNTAHIKLTNALSSKYHISCMQNEGTGPSSSESKLISDLQNGCMAIVHLPGHFVAVTGYNSSTKTFHVIESYTNKPKRKLDWICDVTFSQLLGSSANASTFYFTTIKSTS